MTCKASIRRSAATALVVGALLAAAGCEQAPTEVPTAQSVRGLKPSGAVTMNQVFLSGTGFGSGTLTFQGRNCPFTLVGTLIGPGAISTLQASGTVYNLKDPSQFSGSYIQGTGGLAVTASIRALPGEIWLQNNNGVTMRLHGEQTGFALTRGRAELFINLAR